MFLKNLLRVISPIHCTLSLLFVAAAAVPLQAPAQTNDPKHLDPAFLYQVNDITDVTEQFASASCLPFSDEDDIGVWGAVVAKQISSGAVPSLSVGPPDLINACPNYNSTRFSETQKENLWVLIMTSMSHYESSCVKAITAKGPNGRAGGLLQLAVGNEQAYSPSCRRGDATDPARALICGMAMLNEQVQKDGILFSDNSYWAVLRPNNRVRKAARIKAAIASFAGCR